MIGKICHAKNNQKKIGVSTLISDKPDFKIKTVTIDKKAHLIMIKVLIHQEDIIIINIYA